jgi:glycosyltransferase involved in cell wall biosynthesis
LTIGRRNYPSYFVDGAVVKSTENRTSGAFPPTAKEPSATLVSLELWTPDLADPQSLDKIRYKLGRDFPWALEEEWPVEYWGLRRPQARIASSHLQFHVRGLRLPTKKLPTPTAAALALAAHFVLALRRSGKRIIFTAIPWMGLGVTLARILLRVPAPIVVRVMGRASSKTLMFGRSRVRYRILEAIDRFVLRRADLVVPMGSFTLAIAKGAGVSAEKIVELPLPPSWRETATLAPGRWVPKDADVRAMTVLCAARLVPDKGIDVLLRAFVRVSRDFPAARLELAGEGEKRSELQRLAAALGIDECVNFRGWIEPADIPEFFTSGCIAALPSRVEEGLGMSLVEAGLAGCALVGSDLGGIREIVRANQTGFLVRPDDPDALADAIVLLLAEPAETKRLGSAAQKAALTYINRREAAQRDFKSRIKTLISKRPQE